MHDVIIIGSGPAGLTAGLYAGRGNLNVLLIAGTQAGGQLMLTTDVENYPGFPEGILGPDLMQRMRKQTERFGAKVVDDDIVSVDFRQNPFRVKTYDQAFEGGTVIIATGASPKWLGLPSEERLRGRGVSSCATCDGAFFKNRRVAVIGGGDTAMEDSLYLSKLASSVTLVHRRGEFRASKIMQGRALANPKIKPVMESTPEEILGKDRVEGLRVKNVRTGRTHEIPLEGVFVAIGHRPNTEVFRGQVEMDSVGYIKVRDGTRTSVPGVFVAGDVHDHHYRQAVTAAGFGCMAAMDAEKYLGGVEEGAR